MEPQAQVSSINKNSKNVFDKGRHLNIRSVPLLSSKNKILAGWIFPHSFSMVTWDGPQETLGFFIYYLPMILWTLSHLLNSPPAPPPQVSFHASVKVSAEGKKFSSQWSGIQEFICLKVLSQAKLCYLGKLPKYRSALCFESRNH